MPSVYRDENAPHVIYNDIIALSIRPVPSTYGGIWDAKVAKRPESRERGDAFRGFRLLSPLSRSKYLLPHPSSRLVAEPPQ
jgi:hypothetical protein